MQLGISKHTDEKKKIWTKINDKVDFENLTSYLCRFTSPIIKALDCYQNSKLRK